MIDPTLILYPDWLKFNSYFYSLTQNWSPGWLESDSSSHNMTQGHKTVEIHRNSSKLIETHRKVYENLIFHN